MIPIFFVYIQINKFPIVLPVLILTLPIMLLMPVIFLVGILIALFRGEKISSIVKTIYYLFKFVCAMRGTLIDVKESKITKKGTQILMYFL